MTNQRRCWMAMWGGLAMLVPMSGNVAVADEAQKVSVFDKATLEVPPQFERTQPANRLVEDEFVAKVGEGDNAETARVYMMASGGSVESNLDRWKGQFSGEEDAFKTEEFKRGDWDVVIAEHSGTYAERMGGGPFAPGRTVQRRNYGMLGAIIVAPDGENANVDPNLRPKYFVKMVGPQAVVKANKEAFMKMVKSLKE